MGIWETNDNLSVEDLQQALDDDSYLETHLNIMKENMYKSVFIKLCANVEETIKREREAYPKKREELLEALKVHNQIKGQLDSIGMRGYLEEFCSIKKKVVHLTRCGYFHDEYNTTLYISIDVPDYQNKIVFLWEEETWHCGDSDWNTSVVVLNDYDDAVKWLKENFSSSDRIKGIWHKDQIVELDYDDRDERYYIILKLRQMLGIEGEILFE
jgi:hypothetical protein